MLAPSSKSVKSWEVMRLWTKPMEEPKTVWEVNSSTTKTIAVACRRVFVSDLVSSLCNITISCSQSTLQPVRRWFVSLSLSLSLSSKKSLSFSFSILLFKLGSTNLADRKDAISDIVTFTAMDGIPTIICWPHLPACSLKRVWRPPCSLSMAFCSALRRAKRGAFLTKHESKSELGDG